MFDSGGREDMTKGRGTRSGSCLYLMVSYYDPVAWDELLDVAVLPSF